MMKKRCTSLALALLLAFGASGCAGKENAPQAQPPQGTVFDTEAEILKAADMDVEMEEPSEGPEERVAVDGKIRSLLTGEWIPEIKSVNRPIAVMVNNKYEALPMSGIGSADVIYECPVEGRITRWMCIFENWEELDRIGSVRSCRQYFLDFAQEFNAIYCHFGQVVYALPDLNSGEFDVLSGGTSGIKSPAGSMYDRISRPGKAKEHTLYAFPDKIPQDIEKKGYETILQDGYRRKFLFARDGEVVTYEGYPDAVMLQPGGTGGKNGFGGVKATFQYNEGDHLYYRSTYGSPHLDELTGKQLAVKNVIFQYCDGSVMDSKDYLSFATQAQKEKCIVFTEGKMIEGYWSNPGDLGTPARYYQEDGSEIVLNSGVTFICVVWKDYTDDVVIQ